MAKKRGFDHPVELRCEPLQSILAKELAFETKNNKQLYAGLLKMSQEKVAIAHVRTLLRWLEEHPQLQDVLLVSKLAPTPAARDELASAGVQHFCYYQLLIDITEHALVPNHRMLTQEQTAKLLSTLGVSLSKMPKLLHSDPIARFYNFPKGSVIEITRNNGLQQSSSYFRCVV
jgi:DNA-directed RNA polymerase I, II, and III subunit RPABC1